MKITSKQKDVLTVVYRYRFINVLILEKLWSHLDRSVVRRRLEVLRQGGYVGRFHEPAYRLRGKPATYYLLPAGIDVLRRTGAYTEQALRPMYKNRSVSSGFIEHTLRAADLTAELAATHPELAVSTPIELHHLEDFPRRLADGLLRQGNRWLLLLFIEDSATSAYKRQLIRIHNYFESMAWEINMEADFPAVLLACETRQLEAVVNRHAARLLFAAVSNLDVYTAVYPELQDQRDPAAPVWRRAGEDSREVLALGEI